MRIAICLLVIWTGLMVGACRNPPPFDPDNRNGNGHAGSAGQPAASPAPHTTPGNSASGQTAASPSPVVPGPYDLQVLDTLSRHHAEAIAMARLAATQAQHRELKEFASQLLRSQQTEVEQLRGWRNAWYFNQPDATNPALPGMKTVGMQMEQLQALQGTDFDRMFLQMMIPHHQGAVDLARDILNHAEHAELKELAARVQTEQAREVEQLKAWQTSWFQ